MFVKVNQGQVVKFPYEYADLQEDNPFTNFNGADLMSAFQGTEENIKGATLEPVIIAEEPQYNKQTEKVVYAESPEQQDDQWVLTCSVVSMSQEEVNDFNSKKAFEIRADRDKRLSQTDWTQVADAPVDQEAWATYRQALRDVPAQEGFPWDFTWPQQPE